MNITQLETIESIRDILLGEFCESCLIESYRYKDPVFVSMFKAYISILKHDYGTYFPIPLKIAKVIIETRICLDNLFHKPFTGSELVKVNNKNFNSKQDNFYLKF